MMENNDHRILLDQTDGKEYQIPELVDLNGIGEALALNCLPGSGATWSCSVGTGASGG